MAIHAASPRPSPWKRRWLAAALSLALALLAAELLARARFGAPLAERRPLLLIQANALRGWEMVPDTDHYTYMHAAHVNNLGLRGEDVPGHKGAEYRVLCLGDSLVYGQGVADTETIPVHMQRLLAERMPGRSVRVLNGGVRAYSTLHELGMLKELGARVRPDVVVLFWYCNDLEEGSLAARYDWLKQVGPVTFDVSGQMEGWALVKWELKQLARASALLMETYDLWKARTSRPYPQEFEDAGFERLDGYFAEFTRLAQELGCGFLVVAVPEASAIDGLSDKERLTQRMREAAARHSIPVIDALGGLRELYGRTERLPVLPYDGHYLGEANEAIARSVLEYPGIVAR